MRKIYIGDKLVRVDEGCGWRPLHKNRCNVLEYAIGHSIPYTIERPLFPWNDTEICLRTSFSQDELAAKIQEECDQCLCGEAQKIKERTRQ